MRVLVTGADGFVGVHLCNHLRSQGDLVSAYGGPGGTGASGVQGVDIRNAVEVSQMLVDAQPDFVIHLAGSASV